MFHPECANVNEDTVETMDAPEATVTRTEMVDTAAPPTAMEAEGHTVEDLAEVLVVIKCPTWELA